MKTSVPNSLPPASNGVQNSSRETLATDSSQPRSKSPDFKVPVTATNLTCPVKDTDLQELSVWLEREDEKTSLTW